MLIDQKVDVMYLHFTEISFFKKQGDIEFIFKAF